MRKAAKWTGFILGGLVGLILVLVAGFAVYGQITFKRMVAHPVYSLEADISPAGIARGEYLVRNVMACGDCHASDPLNPDLAGVSEEISMGPIQAVFAAPNLTNDRETGLGLWTDAEVARAIREGIDKDGRELLIMPSVNYRELSDADTAAIVGYLRSLEEVNHPVPNLDLNWAGKALLAAGIFPTSAMPEITAPVVAPPATSLEYGRYLVVLGGCRDCHGVNLDGKDPLNPVPGLPPAPNIGGSSVLSRWTDAQFIETMRTGQMPGGARLADGMPWKIYSGMSDEDLQRIFRYLSSVNVQSASTN